MLAYAKQIENYDQRNKLKHLSLSVSHYLPLFWLFGFFFPLRQTIYNVFTEACTDILQQFGQVYLYSGRHRE